MEKRCVKEAKAISKNEAHFLCGIQTLEIITKNL